MKKLIVAEKPSVGRDISRVLDDTFIAHDTHMTGDKWIITWSVGHLLKLADPEDYEKRFKRWMLAHLPIVPEEFQIKPIGGRGQKQLSAVKKLMKSKEVDQIINACDAGREGELIFAYIYQAAKAKKPVKRLWLTNMTSQAIKKAFSSLRDAHEMLSLEEAARSRAEADWLVGMNSTRAATIRLRPAFDGGAVSLGRVQTPTLAILAAREAEIQAFVSEDYWQVKADLVAVAQPYLGSYEGGKRLKSAKEAEGVVAACKGQKGRITSVKEKKVQEAPPLLYDLTSLQRDASSRYGFTAKRTLAAAQKLYESRKALTYPRTSSRFLSSDQIGDFRDISRSLAQAGVSAPITKGASFVSSLNKLDTSRVVNNAKVSDHHAIIPTTDKANFTSFSPDEQKIYELVSARFVSAFHPSAEIKRTSVETTVKGTDQKDYRFTTRGRVTEVAGWRAVYASLGYGESDQELPSLVEGEEAKAQKVNSEKKETKPPKRYSDASLLGAMETAGKDLDDEELREAMKENGLGTPATRAQIIERLIDVGYIERVDKSFQVTEKGMTTIRLLKDHPLTSPELTGDWEKKLRGVESNQVKRSDFMAGTVKFTQETVDRIKALEAPKREFKTLGECPHCGKTIHENRKAFSCWTSSDPGCGFVIWKTLAGRRLPLEVIEELIKTGHTKEAVTGFKSKKGRTFKARLKTEKVKGKWQVVFDEEWAKEAKKETEKSAPQTKEITASAQKKPSRSAS